MVCLDLKTYLPMPCSQICAFIIIRRPAADDSLNLNVIALAVLVSIPPHVQGWMGLYSSWSAQYKMIAADSGVISDLGEVFSVDELHPQRAPFGRAHVEPQPRNMIFDFPPKISQYIFNVHK